MKIKAPVRDWLPHIRFEFADLWFDVLANTEGSMRIGRIIFAVLVALSVATLPASLGFAAMAPMAPMAPMAISAAQAMPDCEHHHAAPIDKTQKTTDDCGCMAACALNCFNFTATSSFRIVFSPSTTATLKPFHTRINLTMWMGSPPFRPPRS